jgi:protoheme IX farnesyltransferase
MNTRVFAAEDPFNFLRERASAYWELTKPRIVTMVLITACAGFYLGLGSEFDIRTAIWMIIGIGLAAGGTMALNQYFERDTDAIMDRTCGRPVPSGRTTPAEALVFGSVVTVAGLAALWSAVNPLTAMVTSAITALYLGAYTPMKRYSWICHMVGAVPGALPPVAGWAAARGTLAGEPFVLFGIMVLWQLPHSLSIATMYQTEYARAGLSLLPRDRPWGNPAGVVMLSASAALAAFGTLPFWMGFAGRIYLPIAIMLGVLMLAYTIRLLRGSTTARQVMFVSLLYLPLALLVMVLDRV